MKNEYLLKDLTPEEVKELTQKAEEKGYAIQITYEVMKIYKKGKYAI